MSSVENNKEQLLVVLCVLKYWKKKEILICGATRTIIIDSAKILKYLNTRYNGILQCRDHVNKREQLPELVQLAITPPTNPCPPVRASYASNDVFLVCFFPTISKVTLHHAKVFLYRFFKSQDKR